MRAPDAAEWPLPWGQTIRGFRWGNGQDAVLLLHEPGADLDAWTTLPVEIARQLGIETVAVDLPGHGLSDDPWDPSQLPDLLRQLPDLAPAAGRRFIIAAGSPAITALEQASTIELAGLVCLSPGVHEDGQNPPRSPRLPKLFVAGSLAGGDLNEARRLATVCGGWSVVTSLPVAGRGTGLLASTWGTDLVEQIVAFLRDCQRRPGHARNTALVPRSSLPPPRGKLRTGFKTLASDHQTLSVLICCEIAARNQCHSECGDPETVSF
jgi:pimeloyl-ACP methyl ester carboxylesterase